RFNSLDGLKRGDLPATTFIGWPVRGFLPLRDFRRVTANVPNPTRVTGCPRLSEPPMDASRARRAPSAAGLGHPPAFAIDATRSALVKAGISFTRVGTECGC